MVYPNRCYGCFNETGNNNTCPKCGYEKGSDPESALHLPPGTALENKYLLGRALGQGGFGITYLAWDQRLNLKLAIKEYLPQELVYRTPGRNEVTVYKQTMAQHFSYGLNKYLEEARTLARFAGHPGIVWVRDYFEANNTAYIVMEYIEGETLKEHLANRKTPLHYKQAISVFMPVLDALKEVHKEGILHRDISPDNLIISKTGRVVLIDFGAARQAVGEHSRSISVIMKPGFSPEEQYHSKGKQGPWTDVYAVAASIYCAITGKVPPESLSRLSEDTLDYPSNYGFEIDPLFEQSLLKALSVKPGDRYQTIAMFQEALLSTGHSAITNETEFNNEANTEKPDSQSIEKHEANKAAENVKVQKPPQPEIESNSKGNTHILSRNKKAGYVFTAITVGLLLFWGNNLLRVENETSSSEADVISFNEETSVNDEQAIDSAFIEPLDADYYIDYENGTVPIGDLPIGTRVVDPTWEWEFRTGPNYSGSGVTKPVTWIIVAKDHYEGFHPHAHVTLLTEELIGKYTYNNRTIGQDVGSNNWGESGIIYAISLRSWLNSNSIHSNEGFYRAFSNSFRNAVLITILPNKRETGEPYNTYDKVFIPSTTELGDTEHYSKNIIGKPYTYFEGTGNTRRVALLGDLRHLYCTRSPFSNYFVSTISNSGGFSNYGIYPPNADNYGVRPVVNINADTLAVQIESSNPANHSVVRKQNLNLKVADGQVVWQ